MVQRYRHLLVALGMLMSALFLVQGAAAFFEHRAKQDTSAFKAPGGL